MADSVKIKITGDDSDFRRTLGNVGQTAAGVFKGMLGSQLVTAGVNALTNGLRGAITTSMQFEAAMDQVAAISGATGAELDRLTEAAKHYGETTMFSASQAAEALNYMALAGWDVQQSLDALPGVLDLAAASGMALGAASDAVTDYLSAFGMEASKAGYMADLMAYAQSRSNTSATQLSDAYGNCATSMHAAGQDIETTTSMLMALANQGIKGSEAGTQMAAVMRDLTQKMENGQIMIGKTAVKVTDAAGNFRDLNDIIMDVGKATEGMGTAEQSAAIMTTFTARSVKAIQTLLNEGVENVNQYEEALRGSEGTAAEQAKTMMDNLQGDVKIFQSALEGVQITAGEAMNDSARAVVQMGTDVMEAVNQGGKTNGLAGMAEAFIKQIPKLMPQAINGVKSLIAGIGQQLPGLMQSMFATLPDLLTGALDLAPVLLESLGGAVGAAVEGLITNIPEILTNAFISLPDIMTGLFKGALSVGDGIWDGVKNALGEGEYIVREYESLGRVTGHIDVEPEVEVDYSGAQQEIDTQLQTFVDELKGYGLTTEQIAQVLAFKGTQAELEAFLKSNFPNLDIAARNAIMEKFTVINSEGGLAALFGEGMSQGLNAEDIAKLIVSTDLTKESVEAYLSANFPDLSQATKDAIIAKLPKRGEDGGLAGLFTEGEAQGLTAEDVAGIIMNTDLTAASVEEYLGTAFPDLSTAAKNAIISKLPEAGLAEGLKAELQGMGITNEDIATILTAQAEGDESTVESILTEKYAGVKDEAKAAIQAAMGESGIGVSLVSELKGMGITNEDIVTILTAQGEGDESSIESLLTEKYSGIKDQAKAAIEAAWNAGGEVTSGVENGSAGFMTKLLEDMFTNGLSEDNESVNEAIKSAKTIANKKIQELRDYIKNGGEDTEGAEAAITQWEEWAAAMEAYATTYAGASTAECQAAAADILGLADTVDEATARILASEQALLGYQGRVYTAGSNGAQLSDADTIEALNFIKGITDKKLEAAEQAKQENIEAGMAYKEAEAAYAESVSQAMADGQAMLANLIAGQAGNIDGAQYALAMAQVRGQFLEGLQNGEVTPAEVAESLKAAGYDPLVIAQAMETVFKGQQFDPNKVLGGESFVTDEFGTWLSEDITGQLASALEGTDIDIDDVDAALSGAYKELGELNYGNAVKALSDYDFNPDEIGTICGALFGQTGEVMVDSIDASMQGVDFGSLGGIVSTAIDNGMIEGIEDYQTDSGVDVNRLISDMLTGRFKNVDASPEIEMEPEVTASDDTPKKVEEAIEESTSEGGKGTVDADITLESNIEAAEDTQEKVGEAISETAEGVGSAESAQVEVTAGLNVTIGDVTVTSESDIGSVVGESLVGQTASVEVAVTANVGTVTVSGAEAIGESIDSAAATATTGSQLASATSEMVSSAISSASGAASGASAIGLAISLGMAAGIAAGSAAVIAAAVAVAAAAIAAARAALAINSPSKVTYGFGEQFDKGMELGITQHTQEVVRSAVTMARNVAGAANLTPRMDFAEMKSTVRNALSDFADIEQSRDVVLNLDGRELARTTTPYNVNEQNSYNHRLALNYGRK